MRKTITMMLLALATVSATAQEKTGSKWTVTPRVGMTVSDYANDKLEVYTPFIGYGAGVEIERNLNPKWGLSLGAFYTLQGARQSLKTRFAISVDGSSQSTVSYGKDAKMPATTIPEEDILVNIETDNYRIVQQEFNLPMMVNFHPCKGLTLKTGLELDVLLGANLKADCKGYQYGYIYDGYEFTTIQPNSNSSLGSGKKTDDVVYINDTQKESVKSYFEKATFTLPVGIAYEWNNIELDARYHFGLQHLFKSDTEDDDHARASTFLITLGYKFHL